VSRLRVNIYNADTGACGLNRLVWPGQCLADDPNVEVRFGEQIDATRWANDQREQEREQRTVAPLVPAPTLADRYPSLKRQWTVQENEPEPQHHDPVVDVDTDADVVVFQRPLKRVWNDTIRVLQSKGVACVVEIDDDFHGLPKGHPGRIAWAPRHDPDRNWRWLAKACELADLVTCTTPALAERYAPHGRVMVLPNCVPEWYLDVERVENEHPLIGWAGSSHTHVGDLEVTGDAVRRVLDATDARFFALGGADTLQRLGIEGEYRPAVPLEDRGPNGYARQVARMDVQIVPLCDNGLNRAKSALKMIESAALGVVPVVSPTPDNLRMAREGVGLVAEGDWFGLLRSVLTRDDLRAEVAAQGREVMRAWTVERRCGEWADAWLLAYANRMKARAA